MPRRQIGGACQLKKTAGQTGGSYLAAGAVIDMAITTAEPVNPLNIMRPETINNLSTLNQKLIAKRTPAVRVTALAKNFLSASLLLDWFLSADANGNSSEFTIRLFDGASSGNLSDRQYQGAKLVNLGMVGGGIAPQITLVMDFMAIRAEGDVSSPTTIAAYTKDYSETWGAAHVNWGSSATATDVNNWSVNLSRIQVPQYFADGTLFASRITSGPVRGSVLLQQDPDAATVPTTGLTLRLGATGGTAPAIGFVIDLDNIVYPLEAGPAVLGNFSRYFTLADSASAAGTVLTIAAW